MMQNDIQNNSNLKPQMLGMSRAMIFAALEDCKQYVAGQIYDFLMNGKDFDEMTSLSKDMRESLKAQYSAIPLKIVKVFEGKSGAKKYLMRLDDDNLIEAVYMPHDYGNSLCISTQVGCRMGCAFCASGMDGLTRNLTASEMLAQVVLINRDNGGTTKRRAVTNIVLMGSGEPFDNYDNVLDFLDIVSEDGGICISERNISLSTSGLGEKIKRFADSGHKVTLCISLHAPFDDMRTKLMPVNKSCGIEQLIDSAKYYFRRTGRRVIFEYTLIKGENDSTNCAKELVRLTKGFPSHVNLIRLNEVKGKSLKAPGKDAANIFLRKLTDLGVSATIRKSFGNDIEGACGQLRRRYLDDLAAGESVGEGEQ